MIARALELLNVIITILLLMTRVTSSVFACGGDSGETPESPRAEVAAGYVSVVLYDTSFELQYLY